MCYIGGAIIYMPSLVALVSEASCYGEVWSVLAPVFKMTKNEE